MSNFLVPSSVVCARRKSHQNVTSITASTTTSRQPPSPPPPVPGGDNLSLGAAVEDNDGFPPLKGATAPAASSASSNNPPPGFSVTDIAAAGSAALPPPPSHSTGNNNDGDPWHQFSSAYQQDGGTPAAGATSSLPATHTLFQYPLPPSSSADDGTSLLLPEGILSSAFAAAGAGATETTTTTSATATAAASAPVPLVGVTAAFTTPTSAGIFPLLNNNNNNSNNRSSSTTRVESLPSSLGDDALIAFANTDIIMSDGGEAYDKNRGNPAPSLSSSPPQQEHAPAGAGSGTESRNIIPSGKVDNDEDGNNDNMNLKTVVKTIARENILDSPFHVALVERLQQQQVHQQISGSNCGSMTLTEVLSILLGFPDLLNLFCTIQNQYDVLPTELLKELPNIRVRRRQRNGEAGEEDEDEELFYYFSPSSSSPPTGTARNLAWVDNENNYDDHDNRTLDGLVTEILASPIRTAESNNNKTSGGAEEEGNLGRSSLVLSPSFTGENQGAGNFMVEAATDTNGMEPPSPPSQQSSSPVSSSSTSPTTVTTTSSSSMDMEDDNAMSPAPSETCPSKGRNGSSRCMDDEALRSVSTVSNDNHAKSANSGIGRVSEISTTTTETTTTTSTTNGEQEDRNDVTSDNSNSNKDEEGTKERDSDDFNYETRQTEVEATSREEKSVSDSAAKVSPRTNRPTQTTDEGHTKATTTATSTTTKGTMPSLRPQTTLRPDHQKPPLPFHIRKSADAMSALEFLVLLQKGFDTSTATWPGSQMQLKMFLTKITNCCFSKNAKGDPKENLPQLFCAWFEDIMKLYKKDPKRLSKIRKTATTQIVEQLEKMECVVTDSDSLRWNDRKVHALVKGYHKQRELEQQGSKPKKEKRDKMSNTVKKAGSSDSADNDSEGGANKGDDNAASANSNIWQNHNKLGAIVNGYQGRAGSAAPKSNQKADLSLVPLKKLGGRPSGKKSILGMPQQPSALQKQQQQPRIIPQTTGSVWKVAPPGPLRPLKPKQGEVAESQKGKDMPTSRVGGTQPNALRPLCPLTAHPKHTISATASATASVSTASSAAANPKNEQSANTSKKEVQPPSTAAKGRLPQSNESKILSDSSCEGSPTTDHGSSLPCASSSESLPTPQLGQSKGAFTQVQTSVCKSRPQSSSPPLPPSSQLPGNPEEPISPHFAPPSSPTHLKTSNDVPVLVDLLPNDLAAELSDPMLQQQLTDIILDKGRQPVIWASGVRKFLLGNDHHRVVTTDDIDSIVQKLGGFGDSNRVGLDQQLHSVSAIRNRKNDIIGLSMRVGRHISGIATMISDLLFSDPTKSILLLGEPGSGKTTILREVTRLLAKDSDVMIVDTVNEIAGDGDIPHDSVGQARRMMVPSVANQGSIMMECVQNHTPEVMVVDKLGSPGEVPAASAVKDSGTRLICSMNGNLPKLVKNTKLQGLLGLETVVMGQSLAKNATGTNNNAGNGGGGGGSSLVAKSVLHRTGTPVFDLIVELCPGTHHEWKIISNTSNAVDSILQGGKYECQHRIRDPPTGQHRIRDALEK